MQVILLERVAKLGQMGDVVDVKPGFARNYLLLQGKALTASKENIAAFETQKAQLEAKNLEGRKDAEKMGERLDGQQFVVIGPAPSPRGMRPMPRPRPASRLTASRSSSASRSRFWGCTR